MPAMDIGWSFPYPSQRMPVLARNVVATSQPLASAAGLLMLQEGGNAIDAAIAAAIALTVVEPTSNGIGSDAFAIVHAGGGLHGLNASGRSPAAWTPERFAKYEKMPKLGWDAITVPGAVSAWVALSQRFGRLPFATLFEPAIEYAANGFLVSPITAEAWSYVPRIYTEFPDLLKTFTANGKTPNAGERFVLSDHAKTLGMIADSVGEDFYRGKLAKSIIAASDAAGGAMTLDDLASHRAEWVEPLSLDFAGHAVHELPPNGQGIATQIALGMLAHHDLDRFEPDSADALHLQIEAMKVAFADVYHHVGDPTTMVIGAKKLLDPEYLRRRAQTLDPTKAAQPATGIPRDSHTVYLCAGDAEGNLISLIQSNYMGFGSGVVVPNTGIALQNRGNGFTLEKGHPNQVGPRKRPFQTIIPGFITQDGKPLAAFGVMGGPMQPQGHLQVLLRMLIHGQNPQAACDDPRWQVMDGLKVAIERGFAPAVVDELKKRGHQVSEAPFQNFGGAQMVVKIGDGYLGASDWRKDGQAVGY